MPSTITAYNTFTANTKARASEVNENFSNHRGDLLPIEENTTTASDLSHDLGSIDHRWKEAHIETGYWRVGDIKAHHTYNGRISSPGQGWFLCNGTTISSTNYDAQHSSGDWAAYIVSSTLSGFLAPDLTNKYLTGDTVTSEGGTTTISSVGNTGNSIDLNHFHITPSHNHEWHREGTSAGTMSSFDSSGNTKTFSNASSLTSGVFISATNTGGALGGSYYTAKTAVTTTATLLSTTSIQPESIKVQYYIRII